MKKLILAVFLIACLALPALADSPVPGWWVQTEGSEGTKFTDIQDDFLALQAEIDALEQMGGIPGPQGPAGPQGEPGLDGADGKSAFELAVEEGYGGTLEEWLESLNGEDGTDGLDGADGIGVPAGGTAGQALLKNSDTDYDTVWGDVITPTELDTALEPINAKNEQQDTRLTGVERKNFQQDMRLAAHDGQIFSLFSGQAVQDSRLDDLEEWSRYADRRMDRLDSRVADLEESQFILGLNLRIKDTQRTTLEAFGDYSTNREKIDRYGFRLTLKMGKSYEEQLIEKLQAQIDELKSKIQ